MRRPIPHLAWKPIALALHAVCLTLPAAAEIFVVTLDNGATFETRYRPIADPGDESKILFLTDLGNWIALPRGLVAAIEADIERRGFGRLIDAQTVEIGPALNDAAVESDEGAPADPMAILARHLDRRFETLAVHSVEQFVEPEAAQGIPIGYTLGAIPPAGSAERFVSAQDRP